MDKNILLRKASEKKEERKNPYVKYGFFRNPFPRDPAVKVGSDFDIENGSIYLADLRQDEQAQFEDLLIPKKRKPETKPIVFLMDYAARSGKGIGKTAFLNYQRKRINIDLGDNLSESTEVMFAVLVSPVASIQYKKFSDITMLILKSLIEQDIISTAIWRIQIESEYFTSEILDKTEGNFNETLGNNKWLKENNINTWELIHYTRNKLEKLGINSNLVEALSIWGHSSIELKKNYFDNIRDLQWKKEESKIIFDDLIKLFLLAGFTKGIILFDELDKIIPPQNVAERREFCDSIRYFFIDGICENTKFSFFSLLLTIYPYIQELLNPLWEASGLQRIAALSGELVREYTIYFKPLDEPSAVSLTEIYLSKSRNKKPLNLLFPFDEEGVKYALRKQGGVPGKFLTFLHVIIERGIKSDWKLIKKDNIESILKQPTPKEPEPKEEKEKLKSTIIKLKK
jgi:hypothetical protein